MAENPDSHENGAPLETAVTDIEDAADGETVTLGALLDRIEDRPLGFVLTLVGLMLLIPVIGGIPGFPNVAAVVVCLALFHAARGGYMRLWAPGWLRRRRVSAAKARAALERLRPWAAAVDRRIGRRFAGLVESPLARSAIAVACLALTGAMIALSVVPFGVTAPAAGLVAFGLALMARDGALALAGYAVTAVSFGLVLWAVASVW